MGTCKYCGQDIDWIRSAEGRSVPVDPDPVFVIEGDGTETFLEDEGATITGRQARPEEERLETPVAFIPHNRTCPYIAAIPDKVKRRFRRPAVQTVTNAVGNYEAAMEQCEAIAAKYGLDAEAMRREAAELATRTAMTHAEALFSVSMDKAREAIRKRSGPYSGWDAWGNEAPEE